MKLTDDQRRVVAAIEGLIGVAVIVVNAYGQEALGWTFFPLGAVGGAFIGLAVWTWAFAPRAG